MRPQTRLRIIQAAIAELARNPMSSLEQIAEAAGVSRITVFRYFSNRQELMQALLVESDRVYNEVMDPICAAPLPPTEKMLQLITALVPFGATFRFILYQPYRTGDPGFDNLMEGYMDRLCALMRELLAAGLISAHIPAFWAARQFDLLLWGAWEAIDRGELAPKAAPALILHTFYHGVGS